MFIMHIIFFSPSHKSCGCSGNGIVKMLHQLGTYVLRATPMLVGAVVFCDILQYMVSVSQ